MKTMLNIPFSEERIRLIVFTILVLYPLVGMGVDLISPSLPAISNDLHSSHSIVKNIISVYLFGYAFGNFFIGFLSDALGRRNLLLLSFLMFFFASLLPIFLKNMVILLFARFLQGFFIAGFAVIGRAIFSDILTTDKLKQIATWIGTMWGIGPVIGPILGGYLQYYFNWPACFLFFSIFSGLSLIAIFFIIPETHFNRHPLHLGIIKNNLVTIITHRVFFGIIILMGIAYSLLIVFNTLGPFLIQVYLGKSSIYFGHIAFGMGVSFLLGTFVCRFLIKVYEPEVTLFYSLWFFTMIAFIGLILSYFDSKNIWVIVLPSLLMFFGTGIIYPTGIAKALTLFRHLAGSSSAVMNLVNVLITSIVAMSMSMINPTTFIPIAWIYFILLVFSLCLFWVTVRK